MAAYTTIDDSGLYFNTVIYTGTGSSNAITGVGFQPDLTWIKGRSGATEHVLTDSVRGVTKELSSNDTGAEETVAQGLTAFGSDGFTVGTDGSYNTSSATYASWNWLASNTTASNSNGTETSTVSANTTAGFSIMTYAGTTAVDTYGHGLSQKPEMIFIKRRTLSGQWVVYNKTIGATHNLHLDSTDASSAYQYYFNNTEPTNSVVTLSDDGEVNKASSNYVAYVFHSVKGFSKIGSYTGNGNANGPFVYLGFRPAYVMYKPVDAIDNWEIHDNKRDTINPMETLLYANLSNAEGGPSGITDRLDFLSNGFKILDSGGHINTSGNTYIYMAFAEAPFVNSNGVPCNAR